MNNTEQTAGENFWKLYEEERNKLTLLPDIEADFEALGKAQERCPKGYVELIKEIGGQG